MPHSPPVRRRSGERGITLVELLIYSGLSVLVLALVGGMLVNSLTAQRRVSERSQASSVGQIIAQSVHAGVRAATELKLTSASTGQLLVLTSLGTSTEIVTVCEGWYYTPVNGGAMYATRAAPTSARIVAPSAADLAAGSGGWALLGTGIQPDQASPVFALPTSTTLHLTFAVNSGTDSAPVRIATTSTSRGNEAEANTCFAP
ncbi:hypothetical protein [Cryobacterium sp. PH31-O1]|uniref:hypothetical protein n=1 Tax=Cryobacterium sp. PH31-O1 TaxID=3046306 RepID=UPI0024BBDD53|nr:hypothetical protein [Cryobacterium sp. PH31-O1]MDJ0337804.1 hypothetical protein [Cryobacterium sp. PH31-O1]